MYIIRGRLITAESSQAVENGLLAAEGDRIVYAGDAEGFQVPEGATDLTIEGGTILPGFIDCHAHFCEFGGDWTTGNHLDMILASAHVIGNLIDCGFTSVREMSLFGAPLKRAVEKGYIRGPKIMPGQRVLGVTGGHVDFSPSMPVDLYNQMQTCGYLADGVEGCLKAVRQQFREGAEFIKVCTTGGVSSPTDGLNDVQFTKAELEAIVEEAANHGTYVAAHTSNKAGVLHALKAGITSIEHCIDVDDECIRLMKQLDATVVATLTVSVGVAKMEGLPDWMEKKAKQAAKTHVNAIKRLKKEGIRVAYGVDFSGSDKEPYDDEGKEFATLVREIGYTPMEAIQIGTINSAHLLLKEDEIGSLKCGMLADVVVVDGNPLEDITLLQHKERIRLVLQNGKIVKDIRG